MLTVDQLHAIMPDLPASKSATLFPFLTAAIQEFEITAPARTAAFLAQLAHESAQFRFMEEIWGPTTAQRRYEPVSDLATRLGNDRAGDGFRFKGRGPIQVTGRANYQRFGDLLKLDLVSDPARAAQPDVAFRIAALFWAQKGLNELADECTDDAFREITRRINGGLNGLADRQQFYAVACTALGVSRAPAARDFAKRGSPEPQFERGWEAIRTRVRVRRRKPTHRRTRKRAAPRRTTRQTSRRHARKRSK